MTAISKKLFVASTFFLLAIGGASANSISDLSLFYHLNESSGSSSITDYSGNNIDGSVLGSPEFRISGTSVGDDPYAMNFSSENADGASVHDMIDTGNSNIAEGDSTLTVSTWINPNVGISDGSSSQFGGQRLVTKAEGDADNSWSMWYETSAFQTDSFSSRCTFLSSGTFYNLKGFNFDANGIDGWHHAVCKFDNGEISAYLDGTEVASKSVAGSTIDSTGSSVTINGRASAQDQAFYGGQDEVKIFDKALNDTEISNLYNYGDISGDTSNSAPSASFTASTSDLTVDVDASGSSDSDGSISSYEWDWTNDGTYEGSGQTASHTYSSGGDYTVKLRVTDDDGATDTTTKTVSVSSSSGSGSVELHPDLRLWHRSNDTAFPVTDYSGYNLDGSADNSPNLGVTGIQKSNGYWDTGKAISFDEVDEDRISVGEPSRLSSSSLGDTVTLSAWIKADSFPSHQQHIISKGSSSNNDNFALYLREENSDGNYNDLAFYVDTASGSQNPSVEDISLNTWHHVVARYNGSTAKIFVNNSQTASADTSGNLADASGSDVNIGNREGGGFGFDGVIDEPRIYNGALTSTEIGNLYQFNSPYDQSSQYSFSIDSPSKTVYSVDVPLKVSTSDNLSNWKYSLDSGVNVSFTPNTTIDIVSEGSHELTVYAETSEGDFISESSSFTVSNNWLFDTQSEFESIAGEVSNIDIGDNLSLSSGSSSGFFNTVLNTQNSLNTYNELDFRSEELRSFNFQEDFGSPGYDITPFYVESKEHEIRILAFNPSQDVTKTYKCDPDTQNCRTFSSYDTIDSDFRNPGSSGSTNWGYYDGDKYYLFATGDQNTTAIETNNLTNQGIVDENYIFDDPDCGGYYNQTSGVVNHVCEGIPATSVSSNYLVLIRNSGEDPLNASAYTKEKNITDVTGYGWYTGDPEVSVIDGKKCMTADKTFSHPDYRIAFFGCQDSLLHGDFSYRKDVTSSEGGDLEYTYVPQYNQFLGFTEYTGSDIEGGGIWTAEMPMTGNIDAKIELDTDNDGVIDESSGFLSVNPSYSIDGTDGYALNEEARIVDSSLSDSYGQRVSINLSQGNDPVIGSFELSADTSAPPINIESPQNQTYSSSSIDLNVTSDEAVSTWEYSLDGSANTSFTPNTSLTGLSDEGHTVDVYATDSSGNTGSESVSFTVDSNNAPSASFTTNISDPDVNETVGFDASGSSDSDGKVDSYEWDWTDDGNFEDSGQTATHKFESSGSFSVKLRVTDNEAATGETTETYSVDINTSEEIHGIGQDASQVSNTNTQYFFRNKEVKNKGSGDLFGLDIADPSMPGTCDNCGKSIDLGGGQSKNITYNSSGDFISGENAYDLSKASSAVEYGAFDSNYSSSQMIEATNDRTDIPLSVKLDPAIPSNTECVVDSSTEFEIGAGSTENNSISKSCDPADEVDYDLVKSVSDNVSTYEYNASVEVYSDRTDEVQHEYWAKIEQGRLTDFSNRNTSTVNASIDGVTDGLDVSVKSRDGSDYLVWTAYTNRTQSSVHQGTRYFTYEYSTKDDSDGSSDPVGGGGGGSSSDDQTQITESPYDWDLTLVDSDFVGIFKPSVRPGQSFEKEVVVNSDESDLTIDVGCESDGSACEWVSPDVSSVEFDDKGKTIVSVKGTVPEDAKKNTFRFNMAFTDPAYEEGSSVGKNTVKFVVSTESKWDFVFDYFDNLTGFYNGVPIAFFGFFVSMLFFVPAWALGRLEKYPRIVPSVAVVIFLITVGVI